MKLGESVKRKENGYFTVEAVLVFPIVLGVILFIVYLLFFQYDRCLMEQDIGRLVLRGNGLRAESSEELLRQLEYSAKKLDWEKYIAWEADKVQIKIEGKDIKVRGTGRLCFPFSGIVVGNQEHFWEAETEYGNHRPNPVSILRIYRKFTGGE